MPDLKLHKTLRSYFPFGFPISRVAWDRLHATELIDEHFPVGAHEIRAVRHLADRLNEVDRHRSFRHQFWQAGQFFALAAIADVLRYVSKTYCHLQFPGAILKGLEWAGNRRGLHVVEQPPRTFVQLFPPLEVIRGRQNQDDYLNGSSASISHSEATITEMILLSLTTTNPATRSIRTIFDDTALKADSPYDLLCCELEVFFDGQPAFEPLGMTLFECLRAPARSCPDSLDGQLQYIREKWSWFLPEELVQRLLLAADILQEEEQLRGLGPGPSRALDFASLTSSEYTDYRELACFSRDADWMSNVVIIAKSTHVWLDQLSKKYQRQIRLLSDIPDEELDRLARWGFSGLWLIGLWERSPASQSIKQRMGNPEAASSAYSLYDYTIARDLGGETACRNLRDRAWRRGIRLASDMVPNHMGLYSRWVIEHPQWFIQTDSPPYPGYRFTGQDLSSDPRTGIFIEDGYWEHRDAAVVFKRVDKWTGDIKYIYHGNDGTSMPWNDTAQLNFMLPEVREAVIQTILEVARRFPIIRFDAAMTLAKRHYQRLWHPQPGHGGAIPSRSEHGQIKAEFDACFPKEFWREVVDRVAAEVPETLLLAEAFWLMEGYFVRTLGMHRVYNSAFMNMLKMEDNANYRTTVKNVLEFSPEVLKRFVNFMNNPDELTAVEQFGKGDKYFGVAVLLVTMPGLPMFGHGQIEGLVEKYGMEYRRAYWDEKVDEDMVRRHETEIFPLMRRRQLFSGADNFSFYDFVTPAGHVDENVFAYSNRYYDERALIIYNNAYSTTNGWIHTSTQVNVGADDETHLIRKNLAEALALKTHDGVYYSFRDHRTGLEYLRSGKQIAEQGVFSELQGYQYHALLDFNEINDTDGIWAELEARLDGCGVPNLHEACRELQLEPVLKPLGDVLNGEMLSTVMTHDPAARSHFEKALRNLFSAAKEFTGVGADPRAAVKDALFELDNYLNQTMSRDALSSDQHDLIPVFASLSRERDSLTHVSLAWITIRHLSRFFDRAEEVRQSTAASAMLREWMLANTIRRAFSESTGMDETTANQDIGLLHILASQEHLLALTADEGIGAAVRNAVSDPPVRDYLQTNMYNDIIWFNKERLERMVVVLLLATHSRLEPDTNSSKQVLRRATQVACMIIHTAGRAKYQLEAFVKLLTAADVIDPASVRPET